jgi:hypothetical protein
MSFFMVYDRTTGLGKRYGSCAPADVTMQAASDPAMNEAVIETGAPSPINAFKVDLAQSPPAVVAYEPPVAPATPAQDYAAHILNGIAVTCTSVAAVSATYGLDDTTLSQIGSLARDCAAGLGLPTGWAGYPDITGAQKPLAATTIVELYKAQRDLIFAMQTVLATLQAGGTALWPQQSATIA